MVDVVRNSRISGFCVEQNEVIVEDRGERCKLEYLTFPNLSRTGCVSHLFTTRLGGVSKGIYGTLNLSFARGDEPDCVVENFRRIGSVLGCKIEDMVCSDQTHTVHIRRVTDEDRGKGVIRPRDFTDVDGLVTNIPGIALATFYADCVPLYFADPVKRAIGLGHSGWRGTADGMGVRMVEEMTLAFGSDPKDIQAAVGPSICQECYEVSEDVAECFEERLKGTEDILEEIRDRGQYRGRLTVLGKGEQEGKYQLDLWLANLILIRKSGVLLENIAVTDICTCHNPEYLFSHRASQGKRGNLGAFMMLNNS